ncbi:hypothetical protein K2X30_13940 [bacterium]|nr:hypothetical protein [bacterium]
MPKASKPSATKKAAKSETGKSGAKSNVAAAQIELPSIIDESTVFDQYIGKPTGALMISCKKIARINSAGIRAWKGCFDHLDKNGISLTFVDCPPVVLQQVALFDNFLSGGTISSVLVPYLCQICGKSFEKHYTVSELKKNKCDFQPSKCDKCGAMAEFDDDFDIYTRLIE